MVARSAPNALTLLLSKCRLRSSWEVLLRSYELKGTSRELRAAGRDPERTHATPVMHARQCQRWCKGMSHRDSPGVLPVQHACPSGVASGRTAVVGMNNRFRHTPTMLGHAVPKMPVRVSHFWQTTKRQPALYFVRCGYRRYRTQKG